MFCAQCGQKLATDGRFCANCGTPVWVPPGMRDDAPVTAPVASPAEAPLAAATRSRRISDCSPSGDSRRTPARNLSGRTGDGQSIAHADAEPRADAPLTAPVSAGRVDRPAEIAATAMQVPADLRGTDASVHEEGFLGRIRGMLFSPSHEWRLIAAEPSSATAVCWRYLVPLALFGVLAVILGYSLIGYDMPFFGHRRASLVASLTRGALQFVFAFVGTFLIAWLVAALASTFGGRRDSARALKVTVYGLTPFWLAAMLQIVPSLGMLALLIGLLYGFYLMYLGLPALMGSPRDKSIGYIIVVALCSIMLWMLVAALTTCAVVAFGVASEGTLGRLPPVQERKSPVADPTNVPAPAPAPKPDASKGRIGTAPPSKAADKNRESKKASASAGASKSATGAAESQQGRKKGAATGAGGTTSTGGAEPGK